MVVVCRHIYNIQWLDFKEKRKERVEIRLITLTANRNGLPVSLFPPSFSEYLNNRFFHFLQWSSHSRYSYNGPQLSRFKHIAYTICIYNYHIVYCANQESIFHTRVHGVSMWFCDLEDGPFWNPQICWAFASPVQVHQSTAITGPSAT